MAGPKKIVETRFEAKGNIKRKFTLWERAAARFGRNTEKSFKRAGRSASRFQDVFRGNIAANLATKGFDMMRRGLFGFITEASKVEDAVAGFTPILGGLEKANTLVEMLNQTAATTPFQFENITDVAKQLLPVMNGNLQDTIDTFRMLGDTAGGNVQKLESITRGYVKALLKGKPDMESLNMIAEAGVPIFSEMAESMGVTKEQFFEMSKKGKLTSADLTKVFKKMTSEGGMFFGGMEIASKTFTGKMSTLTDNIKLATGSIGTAFLPILKNLADRLIVVAGRIRAWAVANQDLIKSKINDFIKGSIVLFNEMKPTLIDLFMLWTKMVESMKSTDFSGLMVIFKGLNFVLNSTLKIINLIAKGLDILGTGLGVAAAKFILGREDVSALELLKGGGQTIKPKIGRAEQFTSSFDEFGGGELGIEAPNAKEATSGIEAPNKKEAAARAQNVNVNVGGEINVNGPTGTTAESTGPVGFNTQALGQN